ncbi:unnamed protein product [Brassicogethes aeneus]|uniref:Uncharacterized protein n=1 Tax=Brassicogethes aeneus TaxID=1431903 RepID=A0A9P0AQE4_BRAAE|nr:unnamed protein product [Brassicogethes aeneus]
MHSKTPIDDEPIAEENTTSDQILDQLPEETQNSILNQVPSHLYKEGDYIVASFPGKKREHKFVCVIQEICNEDDIEVLGMIECDETKRSFK